MRGMWDAGELGACAPACRRTLLEVAESGDLTCRLRGGVCSFDPEEIAYLEGVCTEAEKAALRLPICITTDVSGPSGVWKVDGRAESAVVARILGRARQREDSVRFHHPDLRELLRRLPNAAVVVYTPRAGVRGSDDYI